MYIYYKKKNKACIIHKDMPFSVKMQNVHGNVIHIANLLNSIEDKKFEFKLTILSII